MKTRIIAALLAAFFMFPLFGLTAYATESEDMTDVEVSADGMPEDETFPDDINMEMDMAALMALLMLFGMTDINAPELSALPPGTASVIDYNTDPDGRLFYTIMTPEEHIFYLIIDKTSAENNVYFLNPVTIADLLALAEMPTHTPGGAPGTATPTTEIPEQPTEPASPADKPQGGNMTMFIIIIILVIVGGGAGWYFKIYRPKQQGAADADEYDPSMDESENDYSEDWGDGDSENFDETTDDDSPPWEGDEESGDHFNDEE